MYPVVFEAKHLRMMRVQGSQISMAENVTDETLKALEGPHSFTLMHCGEPIVCCGAALYWKDRAYLWAFLGSKIDAHIFRRMHSLAKVFVASLPFRRLEAAAPFGWEPGNRWLRSLGFTVSDPCAKAFLADGTDCTLYAMVR